MRRKPPPLLSDKDWLVEQYVTRGQTLDQVGGLLGCSKNTVSRALTKFGIEKHKPTSKYPLLNDSEWLKNAYLVKKMSTEDIAKIVGCNEGAVHYKLTHTYKVTLRSLSEAQRIKFPNGRKKEKSHLWKGGRIINIQGYICVHCPEHPHAMTNGYVLEHRLVMEKKLGRYLESYESVHHVDGDKTNNAPENLVVMLRKKHASAHKETLYRIALLETRVLELEEKLSEYQERFGEIDKKSTPD